MCVCVCKRDKLSRRKRERGGDAKQLGSVWDGIEERERACHLVRLKVLHGFKLVLLAIYKEIELRSGQPLPRTQHAHLHPSECQHPSVPGHPGSLITTAQGVRATHDLAACSNLNSSSRGCHVESPATSFTSISPYFSEEIRQYQQVSKQAAYGGS